MASRHTLLSTLKKSLEQKLREESEDGENIIPETDYALDTEISSVVVDTLDDEESGNAVQVHSSLGHDDLVSMSVDLGKQIKARIDLYKNDLERVPDWEHSILSLKGIEKNNYQDMRKVLGTSLGAGTPQEKLVAIDNIRQALYQSDSGIRDQTDQTTANLVEEEKKSNAQKAKKIITSIHEEVEVNLKFLLDELHRKNFAQREQLIEFTESLDLDEVLETLSDDSITDIIQKIKVEFKKVRKSSWDKINDLDNLMTKQELNLTLESYKAGLRFVLDKYRDKISSSSWPIFIDKLKRKSLGISNYHKNQLTWGGQLKTLLKFLADYKVDIETLIEENYATTYTLGSKTKDPESRELKLKIKKVRLAQLKKINNTIFFGKSGKEAFGLTYLETLLSDSSKFKSNEDKKRVQETFTRGVRILQNESEDLISQFINSKATDKYWKTFLYALNRMVKDLGYELFSKLEEHHQIGYRKWNKALKLLDSLSRKSKSSIGKNLTLMSKYVKEGKNFDWGKSINSINKTFHKRGGYVNKLTDSLLGRDKTSWTEELRNSSLGFYLNDTKIDTSSPYKLLTALAERENWFNTQKPVMSAKKYVTQRFKSPAKDSEGRIIQDTYGDIAGWAEMYLFPYLIYGYRTSNTGDEEYSSTLEELHNLHRSSKSVVDMFFDQLITSSGAISRKRTVNGETINNTNFEAFFLTVFKNEANNFTRVEMTPNGVLINKDSEGSIADTGMDRRDQAKNKLLFVSLDKTNTRINDPQKENYAYIQKIEHFKNEFENIFDMLSGPFSKAIKDKYGEVSIEYQWYKHYIADEAQQTAKDKLAVMQHNLRTIKPDLSSLPEESREVFLFKNPNYEKERDQQLGQLKMTMQDLTSLSDQYLNIDELDNGKFIDTKLEELAGWIKSQQEGSLLQQEESETEEDYQNRITSIEKKLLPKFLKSNLNNQLGLDLANIPSYRTILNRKIKSRISNADISPSALKDLIYKTWIDLLKNIKPQVNRALVQELNQKRKKKEITETSLVSPREIMNLYVSVPFFQDLLSRAFPDLEEENKNDLAESLARFEIINPVIQLGILIKKLIREEYKAEFEVMNMNLDNKYNFEKKVNEAKSRVISYLSRLISERGFNQTFLAIQEEFPEHFKTSSRIEKSVDSVIKENFIENEEEDLIENALKEDEEIKDQSITDDIPYHYLGDMAIDLN